MKKKLAGYYFFLIVFVMMFLVVNIGGRLTIDERVSNWLISPNVANHYRLLTASSGSLAYEFWRKLGEEMFGNELLNRIEADENKVKKEILTLENFVKQEGPNPNVLNRLGKLYQQIGQMKTADIYFDKAKTVDPLSTSTELR